MRKQPNYSAIALLVVVVAAAGLVTVYGFVGLHKSDAGMPPPQTGYFGPRLGPPTHWPSMLEVMMSPRFPADAAERRFAKHIAVSQLDATRSGKFDPIVFAQGRYLRFSAATDFDYFDEICGAGPEFRRWRGVQYGQCVTVPGNAGIWLQVRVLGPGRTNWGEVLYANPHYKPL